MVRDRLRVVTKRKCSTLLCLEGKQTRVVIQQTANDMDQVKRP
jgi:hypothetical protein